MRENISSWMKHASTSSWKWLKTDLNKTDDKLTNSANDDGNFYEYKILLENLHKIAKLSPINGYITKH